MLRFLPLTSKITFPANQVVGGCEKLWQVAERSSTFYNQICTCSVFHRPRANLFVASDEKLRKKGQETMCNLFCSITAERVEKRCSAFNLPRIKHKSGCRRLQKLLKKNSSIFFATTFSNMQKLNLFQERFDSWMVKRATSPSIRFSVMLQGKSELHVFVPRFTTNVQALLAANQVSPSCVKYWHLIG